MQLLGIVVTSCVFLSRAWSRHTDVMCEGGRAEGDKWFDGCRWCVCQSSGPLCSPSECSEYLAQIPPCQRVGSRWWDGCYECHCHAEGIDCQADRMCAILMHSEGYVTDFLSRDGCVVPEDDRCICGIDGVPSCTTEVIDRDALPAITVLLKPTIPSAASLARRRRLLSSGHYDHRHRGVKRNGGSFRTKRSNSFRDHWNEYHQKNRKYNNINSKRQQDRPYSQFKHHFAQRTYRSSSRQSGKSKRLQSRNSERPAYLDSYLADDASSGKAVSPPSSLLIMTTNRCRWGIRWYGGGLRCFCGPNFSITCGDPSFVSSRIDGFRLEKFPCEEGHVWEDLEACRICECHFSGMLLCRRSPACPLPFLIRPLSLDPNARVKYNTRGFENGETDEFEAGPTPGEVERNQGGDKDSEKGSDDKKINVDDCESVSSGEVNEPNSEIDESVDAEEGVHQIPNEKADIKQTSSCADDKENNVRDKEKSISDKPDDIPTEDNDASADKHDDSKRTTTVLVKECKPFSKFREGCKFCKCDPFGKKECDDSRCPKAMPVPYEWPNKSQTYVSSVSGRPVQRPPKIPPSVISRNKPVSILLPHQIGGQSCGRFRVGQKFWDKCNICLCTAHGPICTAKNCA